MAARGGDSGAYGLWKRAALEFGPARLLHRSVRLVWGHRIPGSDRRRLGFNEFDLDAVGIEEIESPAGGVCIVSLERCHRRWDQTYLRRRATVNRIRHSRKKSTKVRHRIPKS